MASKLLRRSGVAFVQVADWLGWTPQRVYIVGVGQFWQEVDVIKERWPDVKVYGCEPHPTLYRKALERFPGELHNVAAGSYDGSAVLHTRRGHKDGSSLHKPREGTVDTLAVTVARLDGLWLPQPGNNVLWLDCEGSELEALRGGRKLLETASMVNVEMTPRPPSDSWSSPEELHDFLRQAGFFQQWIHTLRCGQYDAVYVRRQLFNPAFCCSVWQVQEWRKEQTLCGG